MHAARLDDHVYLIDLETGGIENFIASYVLKGKQAAIIETGPTSSIPNLIAGLKTLKVGLDDVAYVAVTHIHLDHGGGVGTLLKSLPNAKVIVHPAGAPHLVNPQKLWQQSLEVQGKQIGDLYHAPEPVPAERIVPVADDMTFDLGSSVSFKVVETLGHASHHQSYYEPLAGMLFSGDAAGIYLRQLDVVVPTIPAPFRLDGALASLEKLVSLNPSALCYSHFGMATNAVERLKAYAQQLKLWVSIAEQGARNHQAFEVIRDNIVRTDGSISRALESMKAHPILAMTVLNNSVWGAIKYAEKFRNVTPS
jgi:glyoxylase-like metal-dependent hydrolase (beta-lactamase superfamily II)